MADETGMDNSAFESKLIPILREGIEVIKMILFVELRDCLERRGDGSSVHLRMLAAAVVNELFGASNPSGEVVAFAEANRSSIQAELSRLASTHANLCIPLTDGLRMQFLCDAMEGIDSRHLLRRAQELKILMIERELPLPNSFLYLVRRLGVDRGLLQEVRPH